MRPDCLIKAVIWDCGGVIIRTEDDRGRREWERRLGLADHELDRIVMGSASWIQAQCGDITEDEYWSDIQNQLGLDKQSLRSLRDDFYGGDRVNGGRDEVIGVAPLTLQASYLEQRTAVVACGATRPFSHRRAVPCHRCVGGDPGDETRPPSLWSRPGGTRSESRRDCVH